MVSAVILTLVLFASDRVGFDNMLQNLNARETIIVIVKTLVVIAMASISIAMMVVFLLLDVLVSIVTRMEFPISHFVYNTIYLDLMQNWFWNSHSGSHILMACIILFGAGLINTYLGPVKRKKKFIYHKTKESNYISH